MREALLPIGTKHVRATTPHIAAPGSCRINEYIFTCYYEEDVTRFTQLCAVDGAHICCVVDVPFWNAWGAVVGGQHLVIYQHDRELEMEVLT